MKKKLINKTLHNEKKLIIFICVVLFAVWGLVGCSSKYVSSLETIDNVSLLRSGNTYSLIDGKFTVSYGAERSATVPLSVNTEDQAVYFTGKAVYISKPITAIAYGGDGEEPAIVLISNDEGQTWNSYDVAGTKSSEIYEKYIGFTTKTNGWLILTSGVAMGHQENRIFQTSNGGKTWDEIGNTNDVYARVVTGAGFANSEIGFVSFRYDSDPNPVVYRTDDQGKTWAKCSLVIPESFKSITSYATALSPVFNGADGVLPVVLRNNSWPDGDSVDVTVQYKTSDYGKTWTFDEQYNLGLIWANAWQTRDGRGRYEIMSSEMQREFRAQQCSPDDPNVIYYSIRWSSPWVVSYHVALEGDEDAVTYYYTDSTGVKYKGVERLSFGEENGRMVVTNCKTELDMVEYSEPTTWQQIDAGSYSFSIPQEWEADLNQMDGIHFSLDGKEIGLLETLGYDPARSMSQFEGNHAERIMAESLSGCHYPATIVRIRRGEPAASGSTLYTEEHHIYVIPDNSEVAYDFCFYGSMLTENDIQVAQSFVLGEDIGK